MPQTVARALSSSLWARARQISRAAPSGPAHRSGLIPLIASALRWAIDWNFQLISSITWARSSASRPANLPSRSSSTARAAAFRSAPADGSGYSSHQAFNRRQIAVVDMWSIGQAVLVKLVTAGTAWAHGLRGEGGGPGGAGTEGHGRAGDGGVERNRRRHGDRARRAGRGGGGGGAAAGQAGRACRRHHWPGRHGTGAGVRHHR